MRKLFISFLCLFAEHASKHSNVDDTRFDFLLFAKTHWKACDTNCEKLKRKQKLKRTFGIWDLSFSKCKFLFKWKMENFMGLKWLNLLKRSKLNKTMLCNMWKADTEVKYREIVKRIFIIYRKFLIQQKTFSVSIIKWEKNYRWMRKLL
jgi:hypothetical protein